MVKNILKIFHKEISGLHEAAYLLAFFAILSQVLGLLRDRLLAYSFGAGHTLDIYYASFRIPDMIFVSVASIVSISVLIPFFSEKLLKDEALGKRFIDTIFSAFFFVIVLVSAIVYCLVPILIARFLPGFASDPLLPDLIQLTRIMLLSPLFLGMSNFLGSITQIHNRFFLYALSPVLYNLGIILGIVFLYPIFGLLGLAWGVVLGAFFHFFIQVPFIVSKKLFPKIIFTIKWREIRQILLLSLPRTLTISSNQIGLFFLVGLGSLMQAGSIAVFNFSWNLQSVPLSIIGVSYSSAVFPALTRLISLGKKDTFLEQMIASAEHIIFWSLPMMSLFVVLRAQIVRTILGTGNFDWSDTRLTAAVLALFVISLVPQSLLLLFIRGYYALGQTKKPLIVNIFSSTLLVGFAFVFVYLFQTYSFFQNFIESLFKVEHISGSVVLMLPLAYSLGTTINALLHWIAFHFEFKNFTRPVLNTFMSSFSASVIMGYVSYLFLDIFDNIFNINTLSGIFLQGFCSGILGIIFGICVLKLMKNRQLDEIWATLHTKIWKVKTIPADSVDTVTF